VVRILRALPAYFGGKRRLLGAIFKPLLPPQEAPVFVDAFLGGGSVSLYAKARGYRVICNDVAERSHVVGEALIRNGSVRLEHDELARLAMPLEEPGYAETLLAPDVFPIEHARYLDRFVVNARTLSGAKRWLALLLVVKYALRLRPMGNFGAKTIVQQAVAGEWELMNPNYVRDVNARGLSRHPMRVAEILRKQINAGVFSNGHDNEAHQSDVFKFLDAVVGDVVYFDPPYSGTQSYERGLRPLDGLLRNEPAETGPTNPFSSESPEQILPRLFEAADHIPTWVLSYGNQRIDLDDLVALMKKFRPQVEGRSIRYAHCTGLASEESRQRNKELVVVGRK
jgi:16S rRNA G966 N2-methylase RsmD